MFQQKSSSDVGTNMSLAERMKILQEKEEQWKNKGKGAANDSSQFTVAGRMAKRGKSEVLCLSCQPVSQMSLFYHCDKQKSQPIVHVTSTLSHSFMFLYLVMSSLF